MLSLVFLWAHSGKAATLEGMWEGDFFRVSQADYLRVSMEIRGTETTLAFRIASAPPLYPTARTLTRKGSVVVRLAESGAPDEWDLDVTVQSLSLVFHDPESTILANQDAVCQNASWKAGVPLDIAGRQCWDAVASSRGSLERIRVKVAGDALFLPFYPTTGAVKSGAVEHSPPRATELDMTHPLRRLLKP